MQAQGNKLGLKVQSVLLMVIEIMLVLCVSVSNAPSVRVFCVEILQLWMCFRPSSTRAQHACFWYL